MAPGSQDEVGAISQPSQVVPPTAFISYSWDSPDHGLWVEGFGARLRAMGIDAQLDRWDTAPGEPLTHFMENGIRDNQFVLSVCTPEYKKKFDSRMAGVGYEARLITAELLNARNDRKFIPILCSGTSESSIPSAFGSKQYVDFRGERDPEHGFSELSGAIHGRPKGKPPLGPIPTFASTSSGGGRGLLIAEVKVVSHGLAVVVSNSDIRPHSNCEVLVVGVDRYSELHSRYTENPIEPFRILREKTVNGDAQSPGSVFGTLDPKAVRLSSCGRELNRTTGFPELNKAGVWRLNLLVKSSEMGEVPQTFYVAWGPGEPLRMVPSSTSTVAVQVPPTADETAHRSAAADSVAAPKSRKLIVAGGRIRLRPMFPGKFESEDWIVRQISDQLLFADRSGSMQGVSLPVSRIQDAFRVSEDGPVFIELNGRIQWISTKRTWTYFPEKPETPEERRFGISKVSSLRDPLAQVVAEQLGIMGIGTRFSSIGKVGDRLAAGWQIVYDEDGKYFHVDGAGGEDMILIANSV